MVIDAANPPRAGSNAAGTPHPHSRASPTPGWWVLYGAPAAGSTGRIGSTGLEDEDEDEDEDEFSPVSFPVAFDKGDKVTGKARDKVDTSPEGARIPAQGNALGNGGKND